MSFAESSQLLAELAAWETRSGWSARLRRWEAIAEECVRIESEPPLYLMDGTGVPVRREETEGRAGKQPDGPAKTREVKLVTLWTAEALDSQGRPRRDPGSISYRRRRECGRPRYRPRAVSVRPAGGPRGRAPGLWRGQASGRAGRRSRLDLEPGRTVPRGDPSISITPNASKALHAGDPPRLQEWAEAGCEAVEKRLDDLLSMR